MGRTLKPGHEHPLGATLGADGVNFAVFSANATRLELCLFDERGTEERIAMRAGPAHVWHVHVAGLAAGQRYGYRAHGPYDPAAGQRFNPQKLLVDPYARMLSGKVDYHAPVFGYAPTLPGEEKHDRTPDPRDDAWGVPRSIVVDPSFDWGSDAPPEVPWPDTVVYELHVKSFTRRHPDVPSEQRGTYLGVASEAAIGHLKSIGVTTVELMPVHEKCDEWAIARRGMSNYWGYSTLSFFAPDQRFASLPGRQVVELKEMVKRLHAAGIEVVLDVVYNHTCEGDRFGPTLSLRGLDNATFYRLDPTDRGSYVDTTGCGHSLDAASAQTLKLIMDSLRYWVEDMHVDGFRFDLAPTLARDPDHVDALSAFFDIIHQDPVLSRVKHIAEPWDLGAGGYQVGKFPVLWSEWNGRYRDTVRRFWTGDRSRLGDLGYRLTGSSDLYAPSGRRPYASVNFITAHDGFTLRDLVSYEQKHNEANGERNKDGTDDNASWNCGVEGDTTDAHVTTIRARQVRNFLASLYLSQGVPMITSGDEMGKTQKGNNNAYVLDSPVSWLDWDLDAERKELLAYVQRLAGVRRAHATFRRRAFLTEDDARWLRPRDDADAPGATDDMRVSDWESPPRAAVGFLLYGTDLSIDDGLTAPVTDETFLLLLNADGEAARFRVPPPGATTPPGAWRIVIDTSGEAALGDEMRVPAHSLVVLAYEETR